MARTGRLAFLGVAVVFHLVYIASIFDTYFVSPVVHGMTAYKVEGYGAPAKRLVLFVGDGLRADKAFQFFPNPSPGANETAGWETPRPLAPYLRSKVLEHGTFGVSHTRVPTESRPGHVALIAGLYEDVSAVTTGWQHNPVHFDSVFNRSRHTWSWGSPDILPMFVEGAVPGRVDGDTYGAEFEDFSKDATVLDTWVFDKVKDFFASAKTNATLNSMLRQDKNIFFLHLLGLDTTGHSYRPYSKAYLHNIKIVDQGVKEVTDLVNDFFNDDKTAFVFTADHGMSDWGSHGDGHPDNTRTPLIAWGSGVAKPKKVQKGTAHGHEDGYSSDWQLDQIQRNDVAQADVATLMAYLAGLEFPVNSVGELPLEFVAAADAEKAEAMLVNAHGILEQYHIKEEDKKAAVIDYKPFVSFAGEDKAIPTRLRQIRATIDRKEYSKAIQESDQLMKIGLQGLRYLQTYDWLFLRTLVTLGYLGWIAFSITMAVDQNVFDGKFLPQRPIFSLAAFGAVAAGLFAYLFVQSSPVTYYAYSVFPILFWEEVFAHRRAIINGVGLLVHGGGQTPDVLRSLLFNVVGLFVILEIMLQSYYRREMYTVIYLLLTAWPASYGFDFVQQNFVLSATWVLSCVAMSIFTLLPANKVESNSLITFGGVLMLIIGLLYTTFEKRILQSVKVPSKKVGTAPPGFLSRSILGAQVGLIALAIVVTRTSVASLQAKTGLPLGAQVVGWIVLVASLALPFAHGLQPRTHYLHRLMVLFLTFAPMFIILTISYEGLFYIAFSVTLVSWVHLEHRVYRAFSSRRQTLAAAPPSTASGAAAVGNKADKLDAFRALTLTDARIALFFLYMLQSGFFSTGNIASISSFSLEAVARLIPVFDPFSQGALLLLKILAPFVLVSANLGVLTKRLHLRSGALFAVVTGIGDWLTLRFFWAVRDEGSWLEIGESISVFCIASGLCVFVAALEVVSELLVGGIEFADEDELHGDQAQVQVAKGKVGNGSTKSGKIIVT